MALNEQLQELVGLTTPGDIETDFISLRENFPYRPTLFLGLGGTGCSAVAKVKRLFERLYGRRANIGTDVSNALIPPMYAFLGFDSDQTGRPSELVNEREWVHIGVNDMQSFYRGMSNEPFYRDWVVKNYPLTQMTAGCAGKRNLGRLALMSNLPRVEQRLRESYEQIIAAPANDIVNHNPVVYLFCSLSGGTGSGTLLDVTFLLKKLLPSTAETIGLIGVLDGLSTMTDYARKNMRINTFAGLKELNAFMTGTAEGLSPGTRIHYPFNIDGRVEIPFHQCHLISPYNNKGTRLLPEQDHVTSFMARTVFMMCAYSFTDQGAQTPDYAGIMVNNTGPLTQKSKGANTCYLVPGMGQTHFPVQTVANLFAVEAAIGYLKVQKGGNALEGDQPAKDFCQRMELDYNNIKQQIRIDPKSPQKKPLAGKIWEEELKPLFEKRYDNCEAVLAAGDAMPDKRSREISARLSPNVVRLTQDVLGQLRGQMASLLVSEGSMLEGAGDFLKDFRGALQGILAQFSKEADAIDRDYQAIERRWRQDIRPIVNDTCSDDGVLDRAKDSFRAQKVIDLYLNFMAPAEESALAKTVNSLCRNLLTGLCSELDGLINQLQTLHGTIENAAALLDGWRIRLATRLKDEAEGRNSDVESVCSTNVISPSWRQAWWDANPEMSPMGVLNFLLREGWHPINWLDMPKPSTGSTPAHQLALDILSQTEPMMAQVRRMSPVDVLNVSSDYRGKKPVDVIQNMYDRIHPQMQIGSQRDLLGTIPNKIVFCGGISGSLKNQLMAAPTMKGVSLSVSDNLETHRINFFSVSLPVALAGCDMVKNTFESYYDNWRNGLTERGLSRTEIANELAEFHCFPGSQAWPSPTYYRSSIDHEKDLFAKAFAISEILPVLDLDAPKLAALGKTPKEKAYGIFQVQGTHFWMTPYFTAGLRSEDRGPLANPTGKLIRLGSNIQEAYNSFWKENSQKNTAQQWVQWFEENWSEHFKSNDLRQAISKFQLTLSKRKAKSTDQDQQTLLAEIHDYVGAWNIGE